MSDWSTISEVKSKQLVKITSRAVLKFKHEPFIPDAVHLCAHPFSGT